jgi:hypothetical protein
MRDAPADVRQIASGFRSPEETRPQGGGVDSLHFLRYSNINTVDPDFFPDGRPTMIRADRLHRLTAGPGILGGCLLSSLACSAVPFLAPTATPTPTVTPTPTATPSVTPTPTVTLTPTRTITPTVSYLDWPIVLSDTFDDEYNGWYTGTDDDEYAASEISIEGGKYVIKVTAKKPFSWRLYPDTGNLGDLYLSVDVKKNKGAADTYYGLYFRGSSYDCYTFSINTDTKQYRLSLLNNSEWEKLIGWTRFQKIDPAGANQLAVLAQGSQFTLFINGEEVDTFEDDTLNRGEVGVYFGMGTPGDTIELEFDNFDVTAPKKNS